MPSLNGQDGSPPPAGGRDYWRSLDHLADTPEFRDFLHREFPKGASEMLDSAERRHFLRIMGASMALAGLGLASGCRRWPEEHIVPFASRPVGRDPGIPVRYATCMDLGGSASGLLVTSNDGRPTKIEGNPDHPTSHGAADVLAQASILDLYDPDRSRSPLRREGDGHVEATWEEFERWAAGRFADLRARRGQGLAILSEASSSPSVHDLRGRLRAAFAASTWHEYEPLPNDHEVEGSVLAFGAPYRTQLDLEKARVIVCLDADLIGGHRNRVDHIRGFARGRLVERPGREPEMSRLYAFEADVTLTGANADVRVGLRSAEVLAVAAALASRVIGGTAEPAPITAALAGMGERLRSAIDHAAADLRAHRGAGMVVAGARQPAAVHLLAHLMNEALANASVEGPVSYSLLRDQPRHVESLGALAAAIEAGTVDTLVILGGNPVYSAPGDLDVAALLGRVAHTVHLSDSLDETSSRCAWHVNRAHYLEAWGDGRAWDGTYTVAQPLIEPLFGGKSAIELLATIAGDDLRDGRSIVRRTFIEQVGGESEPRWRSTLHDGVLRDERAGVVRFTRETPKTLARPAGFMEKIAAGWAAPAADGWEVVFAEHPTVYDGRFANNGWLQEVPDPLTKLTWDNAAIVSPRAARELDVEIGELVRVTVGARHADLPVMIQPGQHDRAVTLHLGYGRGFAGRICAGAGVDVSPLRASAAMGFAAASVHKIAGRVTLATTQDHHTIEVNTTGGKGVQQRLGSLFREAPLDEYAHHPDFVKHRMHVVHRLSLFPENHPFQDEGETPRYEWGMTIDLNKCVGCSACIAACQAENNIPIVGKEQVIRQREMHWLRVDRYFRFAADGDGYDPDRVEAFALQPVPCMHCENAPCEQVCPVAATVHDADGLNVMVYNRCVGTRYCSNNCPYKVRRFNFLDYHRRPPYREKGGLLTVEPEYYTKPSATPNELKRMQLNPDVSVRMRGVMEKCTYCIQRIEGAKIEAKNSYARLPEAEKEKRKGERIAIADGTITPACAQTCPAEAIVFGDLRDPASRVAKQARDSRTYEMLEELNVKTRTKYMARLRNPGGASPAGGGGGGGHVEG